MIRRIFILLTITFLSGCSVKYSFTGTSISPDIKTVSVGFFRNIAPLVNPRLSDFFTEALKDKLQSETNLKLIQGDADLMFEGEITNYEQKYEAVQANETAGLNRLEITIVLRYTNNKETFKSFERQITKGATFAASENISMKEDQLVKQITDDILLEIFSSTVSSW